MLIDVSGKGVLANEPIAQMLGYSTTERQGISIEELVPLAVQPGPPELRRELMADPAPKRLGMGRQLKALTKSGVELPVEVGIGPANLDGTDYVVAQIVDVSNLHTVHQDLTTLVLKGPHDFSR